MTLAEHVRRGWAAGDILEEMSLLTVIESIAGDIILRVLPKPTGSHH